MAPVRRAGFERNSGEQLAGCTNPTRDIRSVEAAWAVRTPVSWGLVGYGAVRCWQMLAGALL